jgi:RNA-splicing ligase RtcB
MNVTLGQSIAIYARANRKWFGQRTRERIQERIEQLVNAEDVEGAKALEQVKHHILRLEEDYSIRDVAPRVA